jgi:hypothetical protein
VRASEAASSRGAALAGVGAAAEAPVRSVGMQTAYRDGDVQTDPFTPQAIVAAGEEPEIVRLAFLRSGGETGASLPVGKADIEAVEEARRRFAIESAMPPMTDEASFAVRKRLMEQLEMDSFIAKEGGVDLANSQRMSLVEQALAARSAERGFIAEQRVEELRRKLGAETEQALAAIQAKRMKTLRKLGASRKQEERHVDMLTGTGSFLGVGPVHASATGKGRKPTRDIIADYADYGSKVYAPLRREGAQSDKLRTAAKFEAGATAAPLRDAVGLGALARALPPSATTVLTLKPAPDASEGFPAGSSAAAAAKPSRAEVQVGADLETVYAMIKTVQTGKSTTAILNEEVPAWRQPKPIVERPSTPSYPDTDDVPAQAEFEQAVLLLQSLLRGRAAQNIMFEGKDRRLELIQEMRADLLTDEVAAALAEEEEARRRAREVQVARTSTVDAAAGEVATAALDFFAKELTRSREMSRIAALAAAADGERSRREEDERVRRWEEVHARAVEAAVADATDSTYGAAADALVSAAIAAAVVGHANAVAGADTGLVAAVLGEIVAREETHAATLELSIGLPARSEAIPPRSALDDSLLPSLDDDEAAGAGAGALDATAASLDLSISASGDEMEAAAAAGAAGDAGGDDADTSKAAVRIQSVARGRQARKRVATIKGGAKGAAADAATAASAGEETPAPDGDGGDGKVGGEGDSSADPADPEAAAAALRIQSIARGRQARRRVAGMRTKPVDAEADAPAPAAAADPSADKAAVAIQSVARGRQARKQVAGMRNTGGAVATPAEGEGKEEEGKEAPAAEAAAPAAPAAEADAPAPAPAADKAAVAIQSVARGRQARKQVAGMRNTGGAVATPVEGEGKEEEVKEGEVEAPAAEEAAPAAEEAAPAAEEAAPAAEEAAPAAEEAAPAAEDATPAAAEEAAPAAEEAAPAAEEAAPAAEEAAPAAEEAAPAAEA